MLKLPSTNVAFTLSATSTKGCAVSELRSDGMRALIASRRPAITARLVFSAEGSLASSSGLFVVSEPRGRWNGDADALNGELDDEGAGGGSAFAFASTAAGTRSGQTHQGAMSGSVAKMSAMRPVAASTSSTDGTLSVACSDAVDSACAWRKGDFGVERRCSPPPLRPLRLGDGKPDSLSEPPPPWPRPHPAAASRPPACCVLLRGTPTPAPTHPARATGPPASRRRRWP